MLREDLRARIAALNRRSWPNSAGAMSPAPGFFPTLSDEASWRANDSAACDMLESLVPGELVEREQGTFYRVRRRLAELASQPLDRLIAQHQPGIAARAELDVELASFARGFPCRVLFLDLETCGFSGSPVFLIGLIHQADGGLILEQLLARDYAEEPAVLAEFWSVTQHYDVLVSFNGRSFDWPFLLDRSAVHRLGHVHAATRGRSGSGGAPLWQQRPDGSDTNPRSAAVHFDLLRFARRHWKRQLELPNCRLQTLEEVLCRRYRAGDIPGRLVAPAYHAFVRTGDARQLRQVLQHNALDLLTLAQLSLMLLCDLAGSSPTPDGISRALPISKRRQHSL